MTNEQDRKVAELIRRKASEAVSGEIQVPDLVNNPPHYKRGGVETIDFIEAKGLGFALGNVVKYVSRCGFKEGADPLDDLEKAAFYLNREIERRRGKR